MNLYRAYCIHKTDGRFLNRHEFEAENDEAAIELARKWVDGCHIEIWSHDRAPDQADGRRLEPLLIPDDGSTSSSDSASTFRYRMRLPMFLVIWLNDTRSLLDVAEKSAICNLAQYYVGLCWLTGLAGGVDRLGGFP